MCSMVRIQDPKASNRTSSTHRAATMVEPNNSTSTACQQVLMERIYTLVWALTMLSNTSTAANTAKKISNSLMKMDNRFGHQKK